MDDLELKTTSRERSRQETTDYIFDMIEQIAALARRSGEAYVAIHLEAIIAARRATSADRSSRVT